MNKTRGEIFQEWIKALKSGDYPQGQGHLCGDDGYCCLGVLEECCFNVKFTGRDSAKFDDKGGWTLLPNDRAQALNLYARVSREEVERVFKASENTAAYHTVSYIFKTATDLASVSGDDWVANREGVLTTLNDSGFPLSQIAEFIEAMGWHEDGADLGIPSYVFADGGDRHQFQG